MSQESEIQKIDAIVVFNFKAEFQVNIIIIERLHVFVHVQ